MTKLLKKGPCKFELITDDMRIAKKAILLGCSQPPKDAVCGGGLVKKVSFLIRSPSVALEFYEYAENGAEMALESFKATKMASSSLYPSSSILGPKEGLFYLPYQQAGIEFMLARPRVLLADPPGLGKTVEIAGVLNQLKSSRVLIICPASLRLNWLQELEKWLSYTPDVLEVVSVDSVWRKSMFSRLVSGSYDFLAVDEAHYIKEPKSKRSRACAALAAKSARVVLMTGTPVKNRPRDAFHLLHILLPELFPDYRQYALRYCGAFLQNIWVYDRRTKTRRAKRVWNDNGNSNEKELNDILRSTIMLRRSKESALPQLPLKRRQLIEVQLPNSSEIREEQTAWEAVCGEIDFEEAVKQLEDGAGVAFSEMARARQAVAISKVPAVVEHVKNILESGEKVIVFAHHRDVISQISKGLKEYSPAIYVGGMSETQKDSEKCRFMEDESCRVFIGNIQAAGTGLTLTVANSVVFAEMSYCPSEMEQCEDRACRIGQTASFVLVQHIVLSGSLDVMLGKRLLEKQRIADEILAV